MQKLNPKILRYLIPFDVSEQELRECIMAEDVDGDLNIEEEIKTFKSRQEIYRKNQDVTFNLRGEHQSLLVWLNGKPLSIKESIMLKNHSGEFNWGYGGSGPAQLALAVTCELFGADVAMNIYQDFKFRVIGKLPQTDFNKNIRVKVNDKSNRTKEIWAEILE